MPTLAEIADETLRARAADGVSSYSVDGENVVGEDITKLIALKKLADAQASADQTNRGISFQQVCFQGMGR